MFEVVTVSRNEGVDTELRQVLDTFLHLFQDAVGLLQTTARRGLYIDKDSTHVLVRHKSGTGGSHHPSQYQDGNNDKSCSEDLAVDEPRDSMLVLIG